jgi:hypothetical protein
MNLPALPYGTTTISGLVGWLRTLVASIVAGWTTEHNGDGTHHWNVTVPAFNAAWFTGDTSTWTVDSSDVQGLTVARLGDVLVYAFRIVGTDVGAGNLALRVSLPPGVVITRWSMGVLSYIDAGGTSDIGVIVGMPGERVVSLYTRTTANWTNTTGDNTTVQGTIHLFVT